MVVDGLIGEDENFNADPLISRKTDCYFVLIDKSFLDRARRAFQAITQFGTPFIVGSLSLGKRYRAVLSCPKRSKCR
jgi:hypothetical protein